LSRAAGRCFCQAARARPHTQDAALRLAKYKLDPYPLEPTKRATPDGREGVFLALLSLKSLVTTIPSTAFNGILNSAFVPNCPACRDHKGHFCSSPAALGGGGEGAAGGAAGSAACASPTMSCVGHGFAPELSGADLASLVCPDSCQACPGWTGDGQTLWFIVLVTSLTSPLMVVLTLRFLRGPDEDEEEERTLSPFLAKPRHPPGAGGPDAEVQVGGRKP